MVIYAQIKKNLLISESLVMDGNDQSQLAIEKDKDLFDFIVIKYNLRIKKFYLE